MVSPVERRGKGFPLLCIHGSGVDHRLLLPLDEVFAKSSQWRRIYVNLPGFGGAQPLASPGDLPLLLDWMEDFVDSEFGTEKFAVLGNSLGGLLARELVARRPKQVVALALLAPVVDPRRESRILPPRTVLAADAGLLESLESSDAVEFESVSVIQNRAHWYRFRDAALPGIRKVDRKALARLEAGYSLRTALPEERFETFRGPTLIVAGKQDHVVGFEDQTAISKHYPRATVVVLDSAGHNVHLEQPTVVEALLESWQASAASAF